MSALDPDIEEPPDLAPRHTRYLPDIHRLLPQSPDAEMAVLCSFLLSPRQVGEIVISAGIQPEAFHTPAHAMIFDALIEMWKSAQPIDFITLSSYLRNKRLLDTVGGASLVTELFTFVPTAANVRYYLEILVEKWTLRQMITDCNDIAARAYDEQDNVPELVSEAQAMLLKLTTNTRSDATETTMAQNVLEVTERLENIQTGTQKSGLMTGLTDVDEELGGLHDGEVIVMMGSTGGGKTSLAHNILDHTAVECGLPVMIFSYEMVKLWVTSRLICARARINTKNMRDGKIDWTQSDSYHRACEAIGKAPIFIEDNADMSVQQIRARARRRMSKSGLSLIIIDYVQKVTNEAKKKNNSRQRDVAEVSDQIQKMAQELNVPVIALAQINKSDGDVREAEDIAFDAKTVLKIRREDEKVSVDTEPDFVKRIIAITKNNHGPLGRIPVTFLKPFVKFVDYAPEPGK